MKKIAFVLSMMLGVILISCSSTFIVSCASSDENYVSDESPIADNLESFLALDTIPDSYLLQFNQIGEKHNECMDSVLANVTSLDSLGSYLYGYSARKNMIDRTTTDSLSFVQEIHSMCYDDDGTVIDPEDELKLEDVEVPQGWERYVDDIRYIISYASAQNGGLQFQNLKMNILSSNSLSIVDKLSLVSVVSIAKSSFEYNVVDQTVTPYRLEANTIVGSDAAGALGNVAVNALIGKYNGMLVFGPEGVVVAVAADALIGGVKASATTALKRLFSGWF